MAAALRTSDELCFLKGKGITSFVEKYPSPPALRWEPGINEALDDHGMYRSHRGCARTEIPGTGIWCSWPVLGEEQLYVLSLSCFVGKALAQPVVQQQQGCVVLSCFAVRWGRKTQDEVGHGGNTP